jgi:hypothetical protein
MNDSPLCRFFLDPPCARQRQYEALRAVFVDNLSQKQAAARFGYSYQAFRQLLHQFRHSFVNGPPPFSTDRGRDGHLNPGMEREPLLRSLTRPKGRRLPMCEC